MRPNPGSRDERSERAGNDCYFMVSSVDSARQWFTIAVSWEQAAQKLGHSVSSLKSRFSRASSGTQEG